MPREFHLQIYILVYGSLCWTRTNYLKFRKLALYPDELTGNILNYTYNTKLFKVYIINIRIKETVSKNEM